MAMHAAKSLGHSLEAKLSHEATDQSITALRQLFASPLHRKIRTAQGRPAMHPQS
ncbi:hypothetical protein SBC1_49700 (plasmid) [Caballeronia sp. SBC1]|nr:hypothetical protein SBC2_38270 [Caballeronia sp. SBC2]QIN64930.1 hypothetical protein SBC1_49700 [Caballeronia sp. SBC1]